jgi:hypothetical protein
MIAMRIGLPSGEAGDHTSTGAGGKAGKARPLLAL